MRIPFHGVCLGLILVTTAPAFGAAGTSRVGEPGVELPAESVEHYGWPEGVLAIINDPARRNGWQPWFSEWPNDIIHFEMAPAEMDQLNALIQRLAEVRAPVRRVVLSPAAEPSGLGFVTQLEPGNAVPAVFALGSQPVIDQWYDRLPEDKRFGVHQFEEAPTAMPPTLTVYVGHDMVDLEKLRVPLVLEVAVVELRSVPEDQRPPMLEKLDAYASEHQRQRAERLPPESIRK